MVDLIVGQIRRHVVEDSCCLTMDKSFNWVEGADGNILGVQVGLVSIGISADNLFRSDALLGHCGASCKSDWQVNDT